MILIPKQKYENILTHKHDDNNETSIDKGKVSTNSALQNVKKDKKNLNGGLDTDTTSFVNEENNDQYLPFSNKDHEGDLNFSNGMGQYSMVGKGGDESNSYIETTPLDFYERILNKNTRKVSKNKKINSTQKRNIKKKWLSFKL